MTHFAIGSFVAADVSIDPFAFRWHPEVWLLMTFLIGAYIYMVRVIGPKAVRPNEAVVSRGNLIAFVASMAMLWVASDWPMHDISEDYLYSVHMFQHMVLSYFVPPLALLATPTWLARLLLGQGGFYKTVRWFAKPVVAALLFNATVMMLHLPSLVNASVGNGPFHYSLHVVVVMTSLLMWLPVCGPVSEFRMGSGGAMIYLFLQSVVPTVPAAWLTFAETAVYSGYDRPVRLWGLSVIDDQQLAGAIMKVAGGLFLWSIVVYLFFWKFAKPFKDSHDYRAANRIPAAEITGHDDSVLTTADVEAAFARSAPADDYGVD